jgi:hypothetical protein
MVTSTVPSKALLDIPSSKPTSLKSGDHVRVQTERRRNARAAVNSADSLDALLPMMRRAEADEALVSTKNLLEKTHSQMRAGRTEEAMLTIDQAATSLERAKSFLPTDIHVQDLDMKERDLRRQLNQPSLPAGKVKDDAAKRDDSVQPAKPPKRDELPVG